MTDEAHAENVQRAASFLREAGLERLLLKLRDKYIELGQVGGQVQLQESTVRERREIISLLGKSTYRSSTIKIKLSDVDKALRQSGFRCSLPELLTAFFPDQPLVTRPQLRAAHVSHQEEFRNMLQSLMQKQPDASRGQQWLLHGAHGLEWLFARYKNAMREEQERQLVTIHSVASLLNQLPGTAQPERLALYAQRTSGDPHSLDPDRPVGRLFLLALNDLTEESLEPSLQGRAQALRLYQSYGLLVDTISSYVATCYLAGAIDRNGLPDPLLSIAGRRILLLPLHQILQWESVTAVTTTIYVIENPQVFEAIIAGLQDAGRNATTVQPTIICTSGWPSMAALTLLDLLLANNPANRLYYSGDFDLKGLQIAASFLERYGERCHPWHLDPPAYNIALRADGIAAHAHELRQLSMLPPVFSLLITAIQAEKKWAYQEGVTQALITDIQG